jgi:IclR family pca regulon transcriptional regulator
MFVDAFARGIQVIRTFGPGCEKQTLSEVAARAEISRASARRLLHTLLQLNYARFDGRYFSLKPAILDLGYAYISSMEFGEFAVEAVHDLAARMNSSCSIGVLDGYDIVYVLRTSIGRLTARVFSVGDRFPAHILAMGRVQLAALSDAALDDYLAHARIERFTPYTVVDRDELRRILRADRERGWSVINRELDEGVCAIGMPLRDKNNRVIAGLGLGIRPDRADDPVAIEEARIELAKAVATIDGLVRLRG